MDSGIYVQSGRFDIIGGENYSWDNQNIIVDDQNFNDTNGHGTYCASIIQKKIPNIQFYPVKILNERAMSNSEVLIEALNRIRKLNIRVVNLSVATVNEAYKSELLTVCYELYKEGKILVCSLQNGETSSFPAVFPYVIGVKGGLFYDDEIYAYNKEKKIQCTADGTPVFIPTLHGTYKMFGGNSKATAIFTTKILKLLHYNPNYSFEDIQMKLQKEASVKASEAKEQDDRFEYVKIEKHINQQDFPTLKIIEEILVRILNIPENNRNLLYKYALNNDKIYIKNTQYYEIAKAIKDAFNLQIKYEEISIKAFYSIYTLMEFVQREIKKNERI